eukprot:gnl/Trimastix_PCT/3895.p1 GENE.gnl/Trimastix_PCT/3895~~gnl/Trimastix_PCT/3895.p1  ORF type:complete len:334 (+),score=87.53 gnl/Trimastix_PCT/3895:40-1041(+)
MADIEDFQQPAGPGPYDIESSATCPMPVCVKGCASCPLGAACRKHHDLARPDSPPFPSPDSSVDVEGDPSDGVAPADDALEHEVRDIISAEGQLKQAQEEQIANTVQPTSNDPMRYPDPFPLGQTDIDRLLELELATDQDQGFQIKHLKKGVTVGKKRIEGTNIYLGRASGNVEGHPGIVMRLLWDFAVRRKWDSFFLEQVLLEQVDPSREFVYFTGKTPPLITKRDFVQARYLTINEDKTLYASVYKSLEHPAKPLRKHFIRGHVFFSGFVCRRVSATETKVTMVTHTDFKGMLPTWIINQMISVVALKWVSNLRKAVARLGSSIAPALEED